MEQPIQAKEAVIASYKPNKARDQQAIKLLNGQIKLAQRRGLCHCIVPQSEIPLVVLELYEDADYWASEHIYNDGSLGWRFTWKHGHPDRPSCRITPRC